MSYNKIKRRYIHYSLTNYKEKYFIPYAIIINHILPFYDYRVETRNRYTNKTPKKLFGYFKIDNCRKIYYLWQSILMFRDTKLIKHSSIITLKLFYYNNVIKLTIFKNLKSLFLFECNNIQGIKCPNLKLLSIKKCHNIKNLKDSFSCPLLTSLYIRRCYDIIELEEYPFLAYLCLIGCKINRLRKYPHLTYLTLNDCKKIKKLQEYPSITSLTLDESWSYESGINELKEYPHLTSLTLSFCRKIKKLKKYPCLISLHLSFCENISELGDHPLLCRLKIWECEYL